MSGPRLVTWSERQLANSIADLLAGLVGVIGAREDPMICRQIAGVVAAGLTHPKIGAVKIVSPRDNPDLIEQMTDAAMAVYSPAAVLGGGRDAFRAMVLAALEVVFPP